MSKYFGKTQGKKILLSKYIKKVEKDSSYYCTEHLKKNAIAEIKCLIQYLGDVEMSKAMVEVFISCFHSFGGEYDVRYEPETIKGLYDITLLYPELTAEAIDKIKYIYIQDLFDVHQLKKALAIFIKKYGKTDECFEAYYEYVEQLGKQLQIEYEEKAKLLNRYIDEYGEIFIQYLQGLIIRKHYDIEKIISCLPSADLIQADASHLCELATFHRIHFGAGYPLSYSMIQDLVKYGNLDRYPERPTYYVSTTGQEVPALFTKQEYLDSIQNEKVKKIKK